MDAEVPIERRSEEDRRAHHRVEGEFEIAEDGKGLRQAALEMMEEESAQMAVTRQSLDAHTARERSLPAGYYAWLDYLVELTCHLEAGTASWGDLSAEELVGLEAIGEARREFDRQHPPCASCGRPVLNARDKRCADCRAADHGLN